MFKTPYLGPVIAAMLLAGATVSPAAPTFAGFPIARDQAKEPAAGINAWDGRHLESAGITAIGEGELAAGVAGTAWDDGVAHSDRYTADGAPSTSEFVGASKLANLSPDTATEALPLSQVAEATPSRRRPAATGCGTSSASSATAACRNRPAGR